MRRARFGSLSHREKPWCQASTRALCDTILYKGGPLTRTITLGERTPLDCVIRSRRLPKRDPYSVLLGRRDDETQECAQREHLFLRRMNGNTFAVKRLNLLNQQNRYCCSIWKSRWACMKWDLGKANLLWEFTFYQFLILSIMKRVWLFVLLLLAIYSLLTWCQWINVQSRHPITPLQKRLLVYFG